MSTIEVEKNITAEQNEVYSGEPSVVDQDETGVPSGYWKSYRFIGSIAAITLLANNTFIAYSMPVNVLAVINADIGPDPNIALVSLLFVTLKGLLMLLVGSLSDIMGRRWFLIGSQSIGFIGFCIAAKAASVNGLIGASAVIAVAGSCHDLYPPLTLELLPNKYRGYGQAAMTVAVMPTLGLGPVFARMMVQNTALGWRSIYWLGAASTGTSVLLFALCYFPPGFEQLTHGKSRKQQIKDLDYVGFFLYALGLIGIMLSLGWGGGTYPWASAQVIALLAVGVVSIAAFILYECYRPLATPLVPMKLFKIRDFSVAVVVGSVGQMAYYALNIIWPGQIANLYTVDNLKIGWLSSIVGIALIAGEVVAGAILKKAPLVKYHMIFSVSGLLVFNGLASLGNSDREGLATGMTFMTSFFVGWIECVAIVVASLVIPPENIGVGCAFFASTRAITGSIAAAVYVAIQNNTFASDLPKRIQVAASAANIPADQVPTIITTIQTATVAGLAKLGLTPEVMASLVAATNLANVQAYYVTYLSALAFAGCALVAACFASNNLNHIFTSFLNKTVDAPHLEAELEKKHEQQHV
ncbi:fungal trichothecene efflux pump [Lophiostoma macrostomum CBS 122681]|uniref:Fungal trichothecene efflux pump n=1 Tax=Lophiostoma macrostomum CBS 122681 TaxID=1314788 RepID=A0A6A6SZN3_9PLEO|nr:fungal trichothecene efflux pump [Lophiostoma macrostomum CBS 122681]